MALGLNPSVICRTSRIWRAGSRMNRCIQRQRKLRQWHSLRAHYPWNLLSLASGSFAFMITLSIGDKMNIWIWWLITFCDCFVTITAYELTKLSPSLSFQNKSLILLALVASMILAAPQLDVSSPSPSDVETVVENARGWRVAYSGFV